MVSAKKAYLVKLSTRSAHSFKSLDKVTCQLSNLPNETLKIRRTQWRHKWSHWGSIVYLTRTIQCWKVIKILSRRLVQHQSGREMGNFVHPADLHNRRGLSLILLVQQQNLLGQSRELEKSWWNKYAISLLSSSQILAHTLLKLDKLLH